MAGVIDVVHLGLGPIGASILGLVRTRDWARVIGAVDVARDLVGLDAGTLGGGYPIGINVQSALENVGPPLNDTVVVHSSGSRIAEQMPIILDALSWGASVVSTCEELAYPWRHHPDEAHRIDAAAKSLDRTVLATGVNPGFAMDALSLYLSGACAHVETVRVRRIVDAAVRRGPLQRKVGAGISLEEFARRQQGGSIGHVGLLESVAMVAAGMGWELSRIEETLEPVVATRDVTTAHAEVRVGSVAGIRQTASGFADDRERVRLELDMYVGAADPADHIWLQGVPNVSGEVLGLHGDVATAAIITNAIRAVGSLGPGLVTMLEAAPIRAFSTRTGAE